MSLTKESAWAIFKAKALGQPEGEAALVLMDDDEMEAYECLIEDYELAVQMVGVEAQNEAAALQEANKYIVAELKALPQNRWTAEDYTKAVSVFKGSKFEQLHLSAMFRVNNTDLLLELAAPQP